MDVNWGFLNTSKNMTEKFNNIIRLLALFTTSMATNRLLRQPNFVLDLFSGFTVC